MKRYYHKRYRMESSVDKKSPVLSLIYRGLIVFLALLGLILIGGTIYGVFFHTLPIENNRVVSPKNGGEEERQGQTFTGIGRIRVPTNDPQPGMVILFVSFMYDPNDRTFFEELVLRIGDFRDIIISYVGSFSAGELQETSEESIKIELLRRFNAILRLGQIETLFFSDFLIVG